MVCETFFQDVCHNLLIEDTINLFYPLHCGERRRIWREAKGKLMFITIPLLNRSRGCLALTYHFVINNTAYLFYVDSPGRYVGLSGEGWHNRIFINAFLEKKLPTFHWQL